MPGSICDAIGSKVKIELQHVVSVEIKADKADQRVLVLSKHRCYIATAKLPVKVESSFNFLEISSVESKTAKKVTFGLVEGKKYVISFEEDGSQLDHVICHIMMSLAGSFPSIPAEEFIGSIDVRPVSRMKEFTDRVSGIKQKALALPCGSFSAAYQAVCDYFNIDFMEDVAWDVDTIYLSQGSKKMNIGDFDHLIDGRQLTAIISALEHNSWFTRFNAAKRKLSAAAANELVKVMKSNQTIEELILSKSGMKFDTLQRLSQSIASNPSSPLTVLNLSDNFIEDKGVVAVCTVLVKLTHGFKELDLSGTGMTPIGLNHVAETLVANNRMLTTLTYLDLSHNSLRGADLTNLYNFLAQPNVLNRLKLANIEAPLEHLFGPLLRGCTQNLAHLNLARNFYSNKKQQTTVPHAWLQFFSSSIALKRLKLESTRLPADAVKSVLLGISTNSTLRDIDLNLRSSGLGATCVPVLEACLPVLRNVSSLNISDNGFDLNLLSIIGALSLNKCIRKLSIGRNLNGVKQKNVAQIMEAVVNLIQSESSSIEHLVFDGMKVRAETTILINALGLNSSLTHLDISGNQMGDVGARMLSKALQLNKKLTSVRWDYNNTSPAGFHNIALALENNYTLKEMPTPVNDVAAALRVNQGKTEKHLLRIEELIQRNRCPQKFIGEQEYRLQQGLLSSTEEQTDSLVTKIQQAIAKLEKMGDLSAESISVVTEAKSVLQSSNGSKQLLLELQKVAIKAEHADCAVWQSLKTYASDFNVLVEAHLKNTVSEMVQCVQTLCPAVLNSEELRQSVHDSCSKEIELPPNFIQSLILEQIGTEILNKTSEIDLAVATQLSDRIVEESDILLEQSSEKLTAALRKEAQSGESVGTKEPRKCPMRAPETSVSSEEDRDTVDQDLRPMSEKRKSSYQRKLRPMSKIDVPQVRQVPDDIDDTQSQDVDVVDKQSTAEVVESSVKQSSYDSTVQVNHLGVDAIDAAASAPKSPVPPARKRKAVAPPPPVPSGASVEVHSGRTPESVTAEEETSSQHPSATRGRLPLDDRPSANEMRGQEIILQDVESSPPEPASEAPAVSSPSEKPVQVPRVQPRQTTTPPLSKSQSKSPSVDLFVLETEAPKLQHLGADRPRRPKNKAITRPNVGLESIQGGNDDNDDDCVNDFFNATSDVGPIARVAEVTTQQVHNDDVDYNVGTKEGKKLKTQTSKTERITGFMKGLMNKKQQSSKGPGAGEASGVVSSSCDDATRKPPEKHPSFGSSDEHKEKPARPVPASRTQIGMTQGILNDIKQRVMGKPVAVEVVDNSKTENTITTGKEHTVMSQLPTSGIKDQVVSTNTEKDPAVSTQASAVKPQHKEHAPSPPNYVGKSYSENNQQSSKPKAATPHPDVGKSVSEANRQIIERKTSDPHSDVAKSVSEHVKQSIEPKAATPHPDVGKSVSEANRQIIERKTSDPHSDVAKSVSERVKQSIEPKASDPQHADDRKSVSEANQQSIERKTSNPHSDVAKSVSERARQSIEQKTSKSQHADDVKFESGETESSEKERPKSSSDTSDNVKSVIGKLLSKERAPIPPTDDDGNTVDFRRQSKEHDTPNSSSDTGKFISVRPRSKDQAPIPPSENTDEKVLSLACDNDVGKDAPVAAPRPAPRPPPLAPKPKRTTIYGDAIADGPAKQPFNKNQLTDVDKEGPGKLSEFVEGIEQLDGNCNVKRALSLNSQPGVVNKEITDQATIAKVSSGDALAEVENSNDSRHSNLQRQRSSDSNVDEERSENAPETAFF